MIRHSINGDKFLTLLLHEPVMYLCSSSLKLEVINESRPLTAKTV